MTEQQLHGLDLIRENPELVIDQIDSGTYKDLPLIIDMKKRTKYLYKDEKYKYFEDEYLIKFIRDYCFNQYCFQIHVPLFSNLIEILTDCRKIDFNKAVYKNNEFFKLFKQSKIDTYNFHKSCLDKYGTKMFYLYIDNNIDELQLCSESRWWNSRFWVLYEMMKKYKLDLREVIKEWQ